MNHTHWVSTLAILSALTAGGAFGCATEADDAVENEAAIQSIVLDESDAGKIVQVTQGEDVRIELAGAGPYFGDPEWQMVFRSKELDQVKVELDVPTPGKPGTRSFTFDTRRASQTGLREIRIARSKGGKVDPLTKPLVFWLQITGKGAAIDAGPPSDGGKSDAGAVAAGPPVVIEGENDGKTVTVPSGSTFIIRMNNLATDWRVTSVDNALGSPTMDTDGVPLDYQTFTWKTADASVPLIGKHDIVLRQVDAVTFGLPPAFFRVTVDIK